jgi:hypothetical protein
MIRSRFCNLQYLFVIVVFWGAAQASLGQYKAQIGYDRLINELTINGTPIPNGTGIIAGLVEAKSGATDYYPDTTNAAFSGKTFTNSTPSIPSPTVSAHATGVGQLFFGNSISMSGGISDIRVYDAETFIVNSQRATTGFNPDPITVDVMNHSYVGTFGTASVNADVNARLDYSIRRDSFTSVAALNNGAGSIPGVYGQSYNSIIVGRTDGSHSFGTTTVGVPGRTKPDIVAPQGATSFATPVVSSTAALLHSAANPLGMVNARAPEVMKAIIMAGADKSPFANWSNTSTRPLDVQFGVGEVDVYNSYRILAGGESNGSITFPAVDSAPYAWDSGNVAANGSQFWTFTIGQTISEASILLAWNANYADANGNYSLSAFSLADLSLTLYDASSNSLGTALFTSNSLVDNVEHLYLRNLNAGRYAIGVSNGSNFATDFGLAWGITAVPEPASLSLVGVAFAFGILGRRRMGNATTKRSV